VLFELKNEFNRFILNKLINNRKINLTTKCWIYIGEDNSEYGRIFFENKHYRINRLSAYLSLNFDLDSELFICHRCDTPRCFNPLHLFIGDGYDNMRDAARKGRMDNGHKNITHCINDHELTIENTYIDPKGHI
jgi:hypothetical protein